VLKEKFVEAYNATNAPAWNESAHHFASEPGLLTIGGSDGHETDSVCRSGIATMERMRTNEDIVRILKSGKFRV
jgi:hypothetical protein